MHLINLNTSILETFLQEHPDAIFSVSPHFLKLFFYSKKHKRIFALKSNIEDNDDIFSFLKKNAEQPLEGFIKRFKLLLNVKRKQLKIY